jgi:diacylglycerol kinase (ATP)
VLGVGARRLRDPDRRTRLSAEAVAVARARGHRDVTVVECQDTAELETTTSDALERGIGLVIAIGGDGTVRDTAAVLAGSAVPLGIVPAGTGNLLASTLGVPRDAAAALTALRDGEPRSIDLGEARWAGSATGEAAGSSAFVVATGAGLDARFLAAASAEAKRRYGIGAYLAAALAQATDLHPRPTTVIVDGRRHETESIVVLIANAGELIPGLLRPRLPVRPDDGWLHVFVVRGGVVGSVIGALELLAAGETGQTATGSASRFAAREVVVEIDVDPPEPVQVDGDRVGIGRLEARVRPGAVRVLVPSGRR